MNLEEVYKLLDDNSNYIKVISDLESLISHLPSFDNYLLKLCKIENVDNIDLFIKLKNFNKKLNWDAIPKATKSEILYKLCNDFFRDNPEIKNLFIKCLQNDQ